MFANPSLENSALKDLIEKRLVTYRDRCPEGEVAE